MIITIESSEEESDVEWQNDHDTQPSPQDSLMEEELESSLLNTAPMQVVQPNIQHLERKETVEVQRFLTDGCGCDLASGSTFTAESVESYRSQCS